jgi:hypothetical protein
MIPTDVPVDSHPRLQLQRKGIVLKGLGLHGIQTKAVQSRLTVNGLRRSIVKFRKGKPADAREVGIEFLFHFGGCGWRSGNKGWR